MSLPSLRSMYAEAQHLFDNGRLQDCRDIIEDLLVALSNAHDDPSHQANDRDDGEHAAHPSPPSSSAITKCHVQADAAGRHSLFANALLLLSCCYSAVGSFHEADCLLATCQGYMEEHESLLVSTSVAASRAAANQATAAVLYSRAAIRLELYRTCADTPITVVEEADGLFLVEAERRLGDVLGVERLLLADVWHSRGVCCELLASADGKRAMREDHQGSSAAPASVGRQRPTEGSRVAPSSPADDGSTSSGHALPSYLRALAFYSRSMDIRTRYTDAAGVTELKLALTLEHVAHVLRLSATPSEPSRKEEALNLLATVADTRRRLLGPRHPLLASTLLAQGALSVELGRYKSAKTAFRAAMDIVTEVYPPNDVRVAEVSYWLSRVS